jgi:hypothetical protein
LQQVPTYAVDISEHPSEPGAHRTCPALRAIRPRTGFERVCPHGRCLSPTVRTTRPLLGRLDRGHPSADSHRTGVGRRLDPFAENDPNERFRPVARSHSEAPAERARLRIPGDTPLDDGTDFRCCGVGRMPPCPGCRTRRTSDAHPDSDHEQHRSPLTRSRMQQQPRGEACSTESGSQRDRDERQ